MISKKSFHQQPKDAAEFALSELIGKTVQTAKSPVKGLNGLKGKIVDETLNTFLVETAKGLKRVPKKNTTFFFPEENFSLDGSVLLVRPQERIKKLLSQKK